MSHLRSQLNKTDHKLNIMVMGLGRIGLAIAKTLQLSGRYNVSGADVNPDALNALQSECDGIKTYLINGGEYAGILKGQHGVVSALSFTENPKVAQAALETGCSYFDLTEDVACTQTIKKIALSAREGQVFMPQCGLAPGFVGILGHSFMANFERLESLKLRVGALPEFPANQMMYNLTWSTEGLVNEYANPCEAIKNGEITLIEPLEGRELFSVSGVEYEAFNTSGGLSNLCHSLKGKVNELTYKTIRYPGHCGLMRFLFRDLRLGDVGERRDMLLKILDSSVAVTQQDLVLISVVATGYKDRLYRQTSRTFLIKHTKQHSAIQLATASGVCSALDIVLSKNSNTALTGFIEQESITIDDFLENEFATTYAKAEL